ncbi:hypothetical protein BGX27_000166 [Mortierella sp. AM989]|nr:hypothetical protein BGX27_000166 [Mortierella sp. AM989]
MPSFFIIIALLIAAATTKAQNILSASQVGYLRVDRFMYVLGGYTQVEAGQRSLTNQFFSLDLSKSWSTDSPPWEMLSPSAPNFLPKCVAVSKNQTILSFSPTSNGLNVGKYDIVNNNWTYIVPSTPEYLGIGIQPMFDPETNLIYIASLSYMNMFNYNNNIWAQVAIPSNIFSERYFPAAGINLPRRSIMYHGGYTNLQTWNQQTNLTEYLIDSSEWNTVTTTGDVPGPRADHCLAFSEDGNTLIIFGGRVPNTNTTVALQNHPTSEIYLLNLDSKIWKKGPNAPRGVIYPACVVAGEQLVSWGGEDFGGIIPALYIFDLSKLQWVNDYTAPAYYGGIATTSPPTSTNSLQPTPNPSSSNLGLIIGSVGGVLAVLAIIGVFIFYRRRNGKFSELPQTSAKGNGGYTEEGLEGNIRPISTPGSIALEPQNKYNPPARNPEGIQQSEWGHPGYTSHPRNPQGPYVQQQYS